MKGFLLLFAFAFLFSSCSSNNSNDEIEHLKAQIDSLKQSSYKPGFGEFMSYIQVHHSKLWFAGKNENWPLAGFELNEINETVDNIGKYVTDRKEAQMVIMIKPNLDSVNLSISKANPVLFSSSFQALTNKCNYCHKLVNYGFNEVKIPDTPPFSNQVFKLSRNKLK